MASNGPRVYLDSCCYIDVVKHDVAITHSASPNSDVWYLKQLLQAHRDGKIIIHSSVLAIAECLAVEPGQSVVPLNVQERFRSLLTSGRTARPLAARPAGG
mgnify:CR=1 FL=1